MKCNGTYANYVYHFSIKFLKKTAYFGGIEVIKAVSTHTSIQSNLLLKQKQKHFFQYLNKHFL